MKVGTPEARAEVYRLQNKALTISFRRQKARADYLLSNLSSIDALLDMKMVGAAGQLIKDALAEIPRIGISLKVIKPVVTKPGRGRRSK